MINIGKPHLKSLLANPHMRQEISDRLDDQELMSADVDGLSEADFDALHDAAWEAFPDEAPVVKSYVVTRADGEEYPIDIFGVEGAYVVRAPEFDDKGIFERLEEAQDYVRFNWEGQAREA